MRVRLAPGTKIYSVEANAKHVSRNEAELCSPKGDNTNQYAVDCRQDPSFPAAPSHEDSRSDCKRAGQIIKPE
jgi:hypothetical protein